MRGDPQPHEVVHDQAVEETAEEVLRLERQGVRRQKTVCVETQPGGSTAAMSVTRFVALATSRYASRAR